MKLAAAAIGAVTAAAMLGTAPASAGTLTVNIDAWHNGAGCNLFGVWSSPSVAINDFTYNPPCNGYAMALAGPNNGSVPAGYRIGYQTNAPAGITITNATVTANTIIDLNDSKGWGGGGYYAGGGHEWIGGDTGETDGPFSSSYWGFSIVCGWSSCSNYAAITLSSIQLTATETQGPGMIAAGADNLYYQTGHYIRNDPAAPDWSIALAGSDSSGVCSMSAAVDNQPIGSPAQTPNNTQWQQCPNWTWTPAQGAQVDTRAYIPHSGQLTLRLSATNAAGVTSSTGTENLNVDNDPVGLLLSGPTTASSVDGTQYVSATATSGPSGATIGCSVDGGTEQWQNGASRQIAVSGVGQHTITCRAHNFATDPAGAYAYSPTETWSLDIGAPTVSAISFTKIVDALNCRRVRERVKVPAHLVTIRRHHKLIRRHVRARTRIERVERCQPRIVWHRQTVWVTVHRHGKRVRIKRTKRVRIALTPHSVTLSKLRVPYGQATTVSGWLGTTGNIAVAGQPVQILGAPDNGSGQFTQVATATAAADGTWTAQIGPGPSRLIEAVYNGSPTLLPTTSAAIRTVVPAQITIKITPRIVPWGSEIRITGQVPGGYVPTNSNLLRLNVGIGRIGRLVGLPTIQPDGRFVIRWKFDAGHDTVIHPWFSVGTLSEAAFPFGPGVSKRIVVTLGKRTPRRRRHHRLAHRHHHRRRR